MTGWIRHPGRARKTGPAAIIMSAIIMSAIIIVYAAAISAAAMLWAQPDLRSMLALTVAALAIALACTTLVDTAPAAPTIAITTSRETRIAPRHCDPDAAGRPHPRAPTAV